MADGIKNYDQYDPDSQPWHGRKKETKIGQEMTNDIADAAIEKRMNRWLEPGNLPTPESQESFRSLLDLARSFRNFSGPDAADSAYEVAGKLRIAESDLSVIQDADEKAFNDIATYIAQSIEANSILRKHKGIITNVADATA